MFLFKFAIASSFLTIVFPSVLSFSPLFNYQIIMYIIYFQTIQ